MGKPSISMTAGAVFWKSAEAIAKALDDARKSNRELGTTAIVGFTETIDPLKAKIIKEAATVADGMRFAGMMSMISAGVGAVLTLGSAIGTTLAYRKGINQADGGVKKMDSLLEQANKGQNTDAHLLVGKRPLSTIEEAQLSRNQQLLGEGKSLPPAANRASAAARAEAIAREPQVEQYQARLQKGENLTPRGQSRDASMQREAIRREGLVAKRELIYGSGSKWRKFSARPEAVRKAAYESLKKDEFASVQDQLIAQRKVHSDDLHNKTGSKNSWTQVTTQVSQAGGQVAQGSGQVAQANAQQEAAKIKADQTMYQGRQTTTQHISSDAANQAQTDRQQMDQIWKELMQAMQAYQFRG